MTNQNLISKLIRSNGSGCGLVAGRDIIKANELGSLLALDYPHFCTLKEFLRIEFDPRHIGICLSITRHQVPCLVWSHQPITHHVKTRKSNATLLCSV